MSFLTISIVSFNTKELLRSCLEDVLHQTKTTDNVFVLDNASEDGSAEMVEKDFKGRVTLIKNKTNDGFSKAHNQILKNLKSEYCLILNPDTKIPVNTFFSMIKFMKENKNCGIASCKIVDFNGKLNSNGGNYPTRVAFLSWLFNLEFLGIKSNFHRSDKEYFSKSHQVDWVGGTFMIIRKEVIEEIGGFNEDYFMYFEDVEFCFRAKKKGFEIWINPDVEIKHLGGASSSNPKFNQWCGEFKGIVDFYNTKLFKGITGGIISGVVRTLIYLGIFLRIIAYFLIGKFNSSLTYAKVFICI